MRSLKFTLLILTLGVFISTFAACTKTVQEEKPPTVSLSKEATINQMVVDATYAFNDGIVEDAFVLTEQEFLDICALEDQNLDIWTDAELRAVLPVNSTNSLSFAERRSKLCEKLNRSVTQPPSEGNTVETYIQMNNKPPRFDATPEIVAEVIAASGTIVGTKSSLNMWRPFGDNGLVGYHDIQRAISGVAQSTSLDTQIEYIPESITWLFEVSGGNWLIGADILYTQVGVTDTVHYGLGTPNGELVWNPTLNSPTDDDVIEGPLPGGAVSISANGLIPNVPL